MRTVFFEFMGEVHETRVPEDWPDAAVAEVCAFRAHAEPGDVFELVKPDDDSEVFILVATGAGV